jgi:predicted DNA-binding transcriptional regulator AlpA
MSTALSTARTTSATSPTVERLWGKAEIGALFGVGLSTVNLWMRDGRLPKGLKVGKAVRWQERAIRQHFGLDDTHPQ